MATQIYCDPCSEDSQYLPAVRYCSVCDERLCKECVQYHSRLKSWKSHHLIDLSSAGNKIPSSTKKYCKIHPDTILGFYCTQHDTPCCRTCIAINHRGCDNVPPLDIASKDVKNSSLLFDTIKDINHLIEIVRKLIENRDANLKSFAQTELFIKQQISTVKSRLLKQIDDFEQNLITQLSSLEGKNETKIKNQRVEISKLESRLTKNKLEFEFYKDHGSENHLFLALRQLVINNKQTETDIQRLVSSVEEISVKFNEVPIQTIGYIDEITKPCTVQFESPKVSQAQIRQDVVKSLTVFEKIGQINLKPSGGYCIIDIAVTADNMLLLSNYSLSCPKIYIYRDCKDYQNEIKCSSVPYGITVIPDTDTAIVTFPHEQSIQFIHTTNMTMEDKAQLAIGFTPYCISATKDNIIVGGEDGEGVVHILDKHGSKMTKVTVGKSTIYSIHYDINNRLLCRYNGGMCCVTLDGKHVYQYTVSGASGIAVDQQGHMYLSNQPNEIHRLSSDGKFRDVVLTKNKGINDPTALSFNNNFTKLFVVNNDRKSVSVFNCK